MKTIQFGFIFFFNLFCSLAQMQPSPNSLFTGTEDKKQVVENLQTINNFFVENKGQWSNEVLFYAKLKGTNVWITNHGIVYDFYQTEKIPDDEKSGPTDFVGHLKKPANIRITGHVVKMNFAGINESSIITGNLKQKGFYNYFIGNDSSKWASSVALFKEVFIHNLYNNIDARLYFDNGRLRYDLIATPYADLKQIKLDFEGQENISVNGMGDLTLKTCLGAVKQSQIYAYQEITGQKKQIECKFSLPGKLAEFELSNYDPSKSIIIDPLVYSTFLGGSSGDGAYELMKLDASGSVYVSGETHSNNFPTTAGAYQTNNYSRSVFVTKLNATLSQLIYSTFIGGSSSYEYPDDFVLDQNGDVYISGVTNAYNFPTTTGVMQPFNAGSNDGFLTKINNDGSALVFSTYIGGSYDDWGISLVVDNTGSIYLTGVTSSYNFPITPGAFQVTKPNNWPIGIGYISKINSNASALVYSTFLGGTGGSDGYSIAIDNIGNAFISGHAKSGFPTTQGSFDTGYHGGWDTYFSILNPTGTALVYSTYIGGSNDDNTYMNELVLDNNGNVIISGYTNSVDFPTSIGAFQTTNKGGWDNFILKLNPAGNGSSDLIYSTYLGGSGDDYSGNSLYVDTNGNTFFTGYTNSSNFPLTTGTSQNANHGGFDVFLAKMNATGTGLLYSSYLGGSNDESVPSGVLEGTFAYIVGQTGSANFPTTPGAFDETYNGGTSDIFVSKIDLRSIILGIFPGTMCAGNNFSIPYTASDPFNTGNTFTVQLSDATGGFSNPVALGSVSSVNSGIINATIPLNTAAGSEYRIRVVGSDPIVYSDPSNANSLTISSASQVSVSIAASANTVCTGTAVLFTATPTNGGSAPSYQWKKGGINISGATNSTYSYAPTSGDLISCQLTSNTTCPGGNPAVSNPIVMIVNGPPNAPSPGTNLSSSTQIIWKWTPVSGATGYKWSFSDNYASAIDIGMKTTKTETGLTCGNLYTRYIWSYSNCGHSTVTVLSQMSSLCTGLPNVSTTDMTGINQTTAIGGGNITSQGISAISARGLCWSQSPNPTVADSVSFNGTGMGPFTGQLTNLFPNTLYYVRAYATNSGGTSYGNQVFFTTLPITIGQSFGGGIVFYTGCNGHQILIAANSDIGNAEWGCTGLLISGTSTAIGTGKQNTEIIVNACSTPVIAARLCNNLLLNGYNDWYLPSIDELSQLYLQKDIVGGFANYWYWSSSDFYNTGLHAWYKRFNGGEQGGTLRWGSDGFIRAIRSVNYPDISPPSPGSHISSTTQIIWSWDSVSGAAGYKWSTVNDYATAMDVGLTTTKTETGLTCNTEYTRYVWAYSTCGQSLPRTFNQPTSPCFTNCGQPLTDSRDGQSYNTVQIANQCWMAQNLNVGSKINGSDEQSNNGTIEKYCYNNDAANCAVYGGLYQWDELMNYLTSSNATPSGRQGICPDGWHIPSEAEWCQVESNLDITVNCLPISWQGTDVGSKMKSTTGWYQGGNGSNSSGFNASPDGYRYEAGFDGLSTGAIFWSSTENSATMAWYRYMEYAYSQIRKGPDTKVRGFSCRCILDCFPPNTPSFGIHTSTPNQIIWNWTPVSEAIGYKWNTTNDLTTATDLGSITTKTEPGLTCNTAYTRYVWAYNGCGNSTALTLNQSTSSCFTTCGQPLTDSRDGQSYNTVQIGTQCWMAQNLNIGIKINGSQEQTNNSIIEKYCYNDLDSNCTKYGALYQWDELMNYTVSSNSNPSERQGICPSGWHLPSDDEWCQMETFLDGTVNCNSSGEIGTDVGGKLKETGFLHWLAPNIGALNSSGFTSIPGGYRDIASAYHNLTWYSYFWTATKISNGEALQRRQSYSSALDFRYNSGTPNGMSARCLITTCSPPELPIFGNHSPSATQIIWNWNGVTGATGYKWNTTNNYASATEMGSATTKTETGLTCSTSYTRYIWAYNGCGYSAAAILNQTTSLNPPVNITISASANPVCNGTVVSFNSSAVSTGTYPVYQWQVNGVNAGANSPDYSYSPQTGDVITCVLTSNEPCVLVSSDTSNSITLTVNPVLQTSVMIEPNVNAVCAGTTVTFTATPENGGGSPVFAWFKGTIPVGGNLSTFSYVPANGDIISCQMTSSASCPSQNPVVSNGVTMSVNPSLPVSVLITADTNHVCAGTSVTFTATPTNGGTTPNYQWKVNGTPVGTNSNTYSYIPANNDIVTVVLTSNAICPTGNPATSTPVVMVVNPVLPVSVSVNPSANPSCAGASVVFSATPINGGTLPAYQWKVNGTIVSGAINSSYSYIPTNNDTIRVILNSNEICKTGSPAESAPVVMTLNPILPAGISISASANPVCSGSSATFTATPSNGGSNPEYQWKVNGSNTGSNNPSFSYTPAAGDQVSCMMTSNASCPSGNPATSNSITMALTSTTPVSVSITRSADNVCQGTSLTFTATAVNAGTTPVYQWKVNGSGTGTNSPSFTYTPANNDVVTCSLYGDVTCPSPNPAISNSLTMSVVSAPAAPASGGNQASCSSALPGTLTAAAPFGSVVDWFNAPNGGTLLQTASNTFVTSTAGTYYAESRNTTTGCTSLNRTAITLTINSAVQYFADADGDGYGNPLISLMACSQPAGYVTNSTDCNDNDATVHALHLYYVDADGDGYGSATTAMLCSNTAPPGYSTNNLDCNDNDPSINPGAQFFTPTGNPGFTGTIVSPLEGSSYTTFHFEADYHDLANALPPAGYPRLILDYEGDGNFAGTNDRTIVMTQSDPSDITTNNGKRYFANVNGLLYGSTWKSRIIVSDGGNCTTTFGPFDAPDVLQAPNLVIFANDISFSNAHPDPSITVTVYAAVHNESDFTAQNFVVHLVNQYDTTLVYPDVTVVSIAPHATTTVQWTINTPSIPAWCPMQVTVDYTNVIMESNELDNTAVRPFVCGNYQMPGGISCSGTVTPAVSYSSVNNTLQLSGNASYYGLAIPLPNPGVAGATVEFQITETTAIYSGYTDLNGNYTIYFPGPLPVGNYHITGTITDYTLTGTFTAQFSIIPHNTLPNLVLQYCHSLSVQPQDPQYHDSVTLVAHVLNIGGTPAAGPIQVEFTYGTGTLLIGQSDATLGAGQSVDISVRALRPPPATTTLTDYADPFDLVTESDESDNSATDNMCWDFQPVGFGYCGWNFWNTSYQVNQSTTLSVGLNSYNLYDASQVKVKFEVSGPGITGTLNLGNGIVNNVTKNCYCPYAVVLPTQFTFSHAGTYTFTMTADPDNEYVECNEANNVLVVTVYVYEPVVPNPQPNLTFYSCHPVEVLPVNPQYPGTASLVGHIINNGDAVATGPIQVEYAYSTGVTFTGQYAGNLNPGQTVDISATATLPPPATALLTATIDPQHLVTESNESDNTASDEMCWDFQPAPLCGPYGTNFWEHAYNINQSTYLSVGLSAYHLYKATPVKVRFEVSGPGITGTLYLGTALVNDVTKTCSCPYGASIPVPFTFFDPGTYTFTMTADPDHDYTECDETNNILVEQVTVVNPLPDMRILSQYINPSLLNPSPNQAISFVVTYDNVGVTNVNDVMKMKVLIDTTLFATVYPLPGLASGDHNSVAIPGTWVSSLPGVHVIRGIIDADHVINELDETNNDATRSFIVGEAANLYFQKFAPSDSMPQLGDNILIHARIGNGGAQNCNSTLQVFYINDNADTVMIGQTPFSIQGSDSVSMILPWTVADNSTTLVGKIVNTSVMEFNYNDNLTTANLGGYQVTLTATPGCEGVSAGSLTAYASGGVTPYLYSWNNGYLGQTYSGAPGTYVVTVSDGNGQVRTATGTVSVYPLPVPVISGPTSICGIPSSGNVYSTETGMTNYTWTISPGGAITSGAGTNTITVTWSTTGARFVKVSYTDTHGCVAAASSVKNVTVYPLPLPALTGPVSACKGSTDHVYSTDSGMTVYSWSISAGGTITSGGAVSDHTATVTWNSSGAQSVSVNYTNANGCAAASPANLPVSVKPLPIPTITGTASVCTGSPGITYSTESSMTGYTWSVSPGGSITAGGNSTSHTVTVNWNAAGSQSVGVNYTNGNGCTASSPTSYPVTVNPLPVPSISGPSAVCVNAAGNLYSTQPGMSAYSWSVSPGGSITAGGTSSGSSVTVTWTATGAQTVGVSYTNGNGCIAAVPSILDVTVNPLPAPTLSGPASPLVFSTNNVYTTESGMSGYTWTLSGGGSITSGGTSSSSSISVTWTIPGPHTVGVNYTSGNGCTASVPTSFPVSVIPLTLPVITGPSAACEGSAGNVYSTQHGMSAYAWSISAGGTIASGGTTSDSTVTVTWNAPGAQTISVNYTDIYGYTPPSPASYAVTVNALPNPTLTGPASVCTNSSGNIYTTQPGMPGYSWTVSAGGSITSGGTPSVNNVTITWLTSGSKTVSVHYTNGNGCNAVSATNYMVTVNPVPVPTLSGNSAVCVNSGGNVYATQGGMSAYTWTISPGGSVTGGGTAASNTATVTWNTAGPQTIGVNYTNGYGCTAVSPGTRAIQVKALPVPVISGLSAVCAGTAGVVYTTESGMTAYSWSIYPDGVITSGGTTASNTVTVTWTTPGAKTVSVSYTNTNGCTAASATNFPVSVNQVPVPTLSGNAGVCVNSGGNTYNTQAGMAGYQWNISSGGTTTGGGTSASYSATVFWNNAGVQTVSVNYANGYGCMAGNPVTKAITVNPLPIPTITGSTSVCLGNSGVTYTTETGMNGYNWEISAGGTITAGGNSASPAVTVTWNSSGSQYVSVSYISSSGCFAATPTVLPVFVIPSLNPAISGYSTVYAGTTGVTYSAAAGMSSYAWAISGGSITAGQGTSIITVSWGLITGPGSVSLSAASNGCTGTSLAPVTILAQSNVKIFGIVTYDNNAATRMNGVNVKLYNSSSLLVGDTITHNNPENGQSGYYDFRDIPNDTYTLHGSYNGSWGGNNATDALIVQLNAIGSYPLSGLKALAADVNVSTTTTALDALYIKLRTVGAIASYPAGDWKFTDTTVTLTGNPLSVDLHALCVGDVNSSFVPVGFKESTSTPAIGDGIITVPLGEPFTYNIHCSRDADLGAMTLFLGYDKNLFEVMDIAGKPDGMKYVIGDGLAAIAWADTKPFKIMAGDLVVSLNMRVREKIAEPSQVFDIKAGSEFADILAQPYDDFNLKMANVITYGESKEITLVNFPNPFNTTTTIVYTLPEPGHVVITLTDIYGNILHSLADRDDKAGSHPLLVDPATINLASGVYLYKLVFVSATDTYVKVNKMIFTK